MLGGNYVWMLNSHAGYYKRATAIGINMTIGNCAGLVIPLYSKFMYWVLLFKKQ